MGRICRSTRVALAGLVLLMGVGIQAQEKPLAVTFQIRGCAIELHARPVVDLGPGVPGDILESDPERGAVTISTNCPYRMEVRLLALNVPAGHPEPAGVRRRLAWRTQRVIPQNEIENLQPTFTRFPDLPTPMGSCRSAPRVPPPYLNHRCRVQYRFAVALEDVPGEYTARTRVTVSTP